MSLLEVLRKQSIDRKFFQRLEEQFRARMSNQGDAQEHEKNRSNKRPRLERSGQGTTPTHHNPQRPPPSKSPTPSLAADAAAGEISRADASVPVRTGGDRQASPSKQEPCTGRPLALQSFQVTPGGAMVLTDSYDGEGAEGGGHARAVENAVMLWFESQLLKPAFDYIDQQPAAAQEHLKVFSVERENGKGRMFICASASRFWSHYKDLRSDQRHHYEIIRQGMPCHLYFDLEFDPRVNPDVDGDGLVDLLVLECVALMKELFNINLKPEQKVWELDSSGPNKWSRHVVIHQRRAFAHNGHVNAFVRVLIERLRRHAEMEQQQQLEQQQQQQQRQDFCEQPHFDGLQQWHNLCMQEPQMHHFHALLEHTQEQQQQQQQQQQGCKSNQPHNDHYVSQQRPDLCVQGPQMHNFHALLEQQQQQQCQDCCEQPYNDYQGIQQRPDLCMQGPQIRHCHELLEQQQQQQQQCQALCQQQLHMHDHELQLDPIYMLPHAHHGKQQQRQDLCQQQLYAHRHELQPDLYQMQLDMQFRGEQKLHLHHHHHHHHHHQQQQQQQQQQRTTSEHVHPALGTPSASPAQVPFLNKSADGTKSTQPHSPHAIRHSQNAFTVQMPLPNNSMHTSRSTQPHSPHALPHSQNAFTAPMPLPSTCRHTSPRHTQPRARYSDMWVIKEAGRSCSKPEQHPVGPDQPKECRPADVPPVQSDGSMRESGLDGGLDTTSAGAEQQRTLFIDTGVYTRNRAFRLCWSSKAGKEHKLKPTHRYAMATFLSRNRSNSSSSSSSKYVRTDVGSNNSKTDALPKVGGEPEGQQPEGEQCRDHSLQHHNQQHYNQGQQPEGEQCRNQTLQHHDQQHNQGQQHPQQHNDQGRQHPQQHNDQGQRHHDLQQQQQQQQQQQKQHVHLVEQEGQQQDCLAHLFQQQQQQQQHQDYCAPQQQQQQPQPQEVAGSPALMQQPHKKSRAASHTHNSSARLKHQDFGMPAKQAETVFLQSMVTDTHGCDHTPHLCLFDEADAAQHTGFILWDDSGTKTGRRTSCLHPAQQAALKAKPTQLRPGSSLFGYGSSPLGAELDGFVRDVCGTQGGVGSSDYRTWMLALESQTITYTSKNTRWCANVGRQHKSNGVYWVIDLRRGTWVQRCHDPDCAGFSSHALPLPIPLWQASANRLMGLRASLLPQQQTLEEQQQEDHLDLVQPQKQHHHHHHQDQQQTLQEQQQQCYMGLEQQQQQQHSNLPGPAGDASEAEYDELCCRALELYEASVEGARDGSA
ncbi:hypothetical protein DUNSADRAFT_3480 [Dunaliella salina]|uniref:DNA-directed primase/polymerase protein n=1 Tax=Dunaliella salina TaxID=3046 RepID=A0ABZ3L9E8_DUNSA|nr:hypothetical protein DUNSADRAFT_3480 [Dunaliella salina]|eukprot:KAF5838046.1 hypothetical protein DUNSADRAFT_3480 [Dunaliella salina]